MEEGIEEVEENLRKFGSCLQDLNSFPPEKESEILSVSLSSCDV
jgi:hypothetical protein